MRVWHIYGYENMYVSAWTCMFTFVWSFAVRSDVCLMGVQGEGGSQMARFSPLDCLFVAVFILRSIDLRLFYFIFCAEEVLMGMLAGRPRSRI